jgi:hypothetical protein
MATFVATKTWGADGKTPKCIRVRAVEGHLSTSFLTDTVTRCTVTSLDVGCVRILETDHTLYSSFHYPAHFDPWKAVKTHCDRMLKPS